MKGLRFKEGDLAAVLPHLEGLDCVIDATAGVFIAKLPTQEEGYRIICHPGCRVVHEAKVGGGRVEIVVKNL